MGSWFGPKAFAQFGREVRGNVAMMWALMGAGLIGIVGLTVDFTHAQTIQAQLQNASDGAALVAERSANLPIAQRTAAAKAFFDAEMGSLASSAQFSVTQLQTGGTRVEASLPMPLSLARIINATDWRVKVASEAEADASPPIEVALVLDNTGSMSNDMVGLRTASQNLVNFLLQIPGDSVSVALVPFVAMVNVGNGDTSFIDTTGIAPFNGELLEGRDIASRSASGTVNCTTLLPATAIGSGSTAGVAGGLTSKDSPYAVSWRLNGSGSGATCIASNPATINYWALYQRMGGNNAWKGCVEARPEPYDIDDTPPSVANPASLFVPAFWIDVAGNRSNTASSNSYITDSDGLPSGTTYLTTTVSGTTYNTGAELSVWKYRGGLTTTSATSGTYPDQRGPNRGCPTPIVPLTSNATAITAGISAMQYWNGGGTNQVEGLAWGWRVLSPGAPFTQGRPYHDPNNPVRKVMVMMTDGENTNINGTSDSIMQSDYSAYSHLGQWLNSTNPPGYRSSLPATCPNAASCMRHHKSGSSWVNADSSTDMVDVIDDREEVLCQSIKDIGIEIYTIQFRDATAANATRLRNCASGADHFYTAANASELDSAFHAIGSGIGQLRITH